jgi:hypothetical protein
MKGQKEETTMNTTTNNATPQTPTPAVLGPVKITLPDGRTFEGPTHKDARKAMSKALRKENRLARRARNRSAAGEQECYAWIGRMHCNPSWDIKVVVEGGGDGFETAVRTNKLDELFQHDEDLKGAKFQAIAVEGDTAWAVKFDDLWYALGRSRKDEARAHMEMPGEQQERLDALAEKAFAKRDAAEIAAVEAQAKKDAAKKTNGTGKK